MNIILIAVFSLLASSSCQWLAKEQAKPEIQAAEKEVIEGVEKMAIPIIEEAVESEL